MKKLTLAILALAITASNLSLANVRETGGSASFEVALRQTALGSTVLPAVENALMDQGFQRETARNLTPVWKSSGQSYQAKIVYKSYASNAVIEIVLSGSLKQGLDLKSIQVIK